ncbi:hypothetical protein IP91_01312 [Pseudoduganella lurida]|uniref:Uncharacterized protein n=1 Tax=Pseudoduganella lurida TaxID=1036180 RepID=A0A562RME5_9BURK|nr:hypothetical protein [Pseudoduganella lurida]TWI70228.1 hypothetical protein IP91_01312 [Pseudoduganella lurida]
MDNKDDKRRQLIHAMLAQPGDPDDAEGHLRPWRALAVHLIPLIGDSGFGALYGRTGRLLAPQFGWLSPRPSTQTLDALFQTLKEDLAGADPAQAALANEALLGTFTRLLSDLIGAALTTRLIDTAWNDARTQENAGEQK